MSSILSHGAIPIVETGNPHYVITICAFSLTLPSENVMRNLLATHILPYYRFRSIPHGSFWRPVEVDIEQHLHTCSVSNGAHLHQFLETLMNRPLSKDIPPWELHLIRNNCVTAADGPHSTDRRTVLQDEKPYHCIAFRVDHCVGDGVSLVKALGKMLTDEKGNPLAPSQLMGLRRATEAPIISERIFSRLCTSLTQWTATVCSSWKLLRGIGTTLMMGFGAYDSDTPLNIPLTVRRNKGVKFCLQQKATFGGPWSLDYIKLIKNKLNVSMNDLFIGAFAGAVRRYCEQEQADDEAQEARLQSTLLHKKPVNNVFYRALMAYAFLRDRSVYDDNDRALANSWTLTSVEIPANEPNRLKRITRTHAITEALKNSLLPLSTMIVNTCANACLPRRFMQNATWQTYNRHSCVFSSIPGPQSPVYVGGALLSHIQVLYPNCLPQIEVLTYAGRVFFCLVADPTAIKHPQRLVDNFAQELRDLGAEVGIKETTLDTVASNM